MSVFLEGLNDQQREAVMHKDGPMLIIAGAGTGKTKVVTSRILNLILNEKVDPGSILALTFTEKAAREMEERIDLQMPLGYEEVNIRTFHGFCDRVLKESGFEIGLDPSYRLLKSVDAGMLIKKNLFRFKLDYYRPLGNPAKFIDSLLNYFSRLKDEDILPSAFLSYAKDQCQKADSDEEKEEAEKMFELATFYNQYQNFVRQSGFLDFGDLIFYTLRLLESRKNVLKMYQERFKYIMVDEFQDTNFAQSKLVDLLSNGHGNLVVVGDDDQSIYKWRGASLANILSFEKKYNDPKQVVLNQNYRSGQKILDLSYGVIQNNNPLRLEFEQGVDKKLISNSPEDVDVTVAKAQNYVDEVEYVVSKIGELSKECEYRDCVILARTNSILDAFAKGLERAQIPFSVSRVQDFFRKPIIKDFLAFLNFLKNPYDDMSLMRILGFQGFGVEMVSVLALAHEAKKKQVSIWQSLNYGKIDDGQAALPGLGDESLNKALAVLVEALESKRDASVSRILNGLLTETDFLKRLSENADENWEDIEYVRCFSQMVADFESQELGGDVEAFLDYLSLLEDSGDLPDLPKVDDNQVRLMTIHSSKGLEFENVFVVSLVQNRFPSVNRREPFVVPEELIDEVLPTDKGMHVMEERRLFYVACTRAKKRLFLTLSEKYGGSRKWKPSIFVKESEECSGVSLHDIKSVGDELIADKPGDAKQFADYEHEAPMPKKLSFSQFSSFERCPQQYRFRYLLRLPSMMSHAANFGSSVHNTLNAFYQVLQRGDEVSLGLMKELYEKYWIPGGYESIAHHNARKKKGWEILEAFYHENSNPFVVPAFLERGFTLKLDNCDVTGRIDRIDKLDDGSFEIIDYKTGTYKKKANLDKDLQLTLYALAARDLFKINASKLSLYFLEDNVKVSTTRTNEQLEACAQDISELVETMRGDDFLPTPGFACNYCEFRMICDAAK